MLIENTKTITIIGLIDNIGGREIEVRNIVKALSEKYHVRLVSLFFMTKDSEAVKDLDCDWTNINYELNNSNILLKIISFFLKIYHSAKTPSYFLVDNRISRILFNLKKLKTKILQKEIDNSNAILYCGTLHLNALNDMITYCYKTNKPIVLRTTGQIKIIPNDLEKLLPYVSSTLVHSLSNTTILKRIVPNNINVIDQTSLKENQLLSMPIEKKKFLIYGYLGRFSEEKGIVELLTIFSNLSKKLIVAGSGPLINQVKTFETKNNIIILETVSPAQIADYYKQIDVLIIPSFEEAGPLVGVEAMAAGKIILSTKVGAMTDRLSNTKNNFWFDINDKETLINQLNNISNMSPDMIIEIRQNVRQHYISNYSIQKISKNYIDIFDKVLI